MKALVLEKKQLLSLRDIDISENLSPDSVRVAPKAVGICGSDIHYYLHGGIGSFIVKQPMVLGHEAAGIVVEVGANVKTLKRGDRVCMEPGIPNLASIESRTGRYNIDPDVSFWATPPIHGCLRETVTHPASFTYKLPESVSFDEGALVEPLAVGMHASIKARITPGDTALVTGAGTIGIMTALCAISAGCSKVIIADVKQTKLDIAQTIGPFVTVNSAKTDLLETVSYETNGRGVNVVFEASGNEQVCSGTMRFAAPGGKIVFIGMPGKPVLLDIVQAQAKELEIISIFRYANVYQRAINLIASGHLSVSNMITERFSFEDSIKAYEFASKMPENTMKVMIEL